MWMSFLSFSYSNAFSSTFAFFQPHNCEAITSTIKKIKNFTSKAKQKCKRATKQTHKKSDQNHND